jgi:hypothetical protein
MRVIVTVLLHGAESLWESNSHSANQENLRLLWNPKVRYRVHKSPSLVPVLSQMHPVHTFPPYFLKIYSNFILSSTPRSSEWYLPLKGNSYYSKISLDRQKSTVIFRRPLLPLCGSRNKMNIHLEYRSCHNVCSFCCNFEIQIWTPVSCGPSCGSGNLLLGWQVHGPPIFKPKTSKIRGEVASHMIARFGSK